MRKFLVAFGILASLGLAYQILFVKTNTLEEYASYIAYPILSVQHCVVQPFKTYFEQRKTTAALQEELAKAQQERDKLLAQNIELSALIDYAQETQELLDFKKRYDFTHCTLAQVLAKNFSEQSHFFLVDKGSHAGIKPEMVALYNDCLIGKVVEVYPYYSKVLLITDQQCKVAVYCAQSKATGIYQGSNQEWCSQLNHVSHLSQLEEGELVISSGDGLIFPRGFGVGKIKSFTTDGLFHHVALELLLDFRAINYCFLIQNGSAIIEPNDSHTESQAPCKKNLPSA